mmetsp:Transcript_23072/g.74707  ORF Transcript_23072/g.74707 Transcript_23072/m.74707 type:complete len:222 (+) Transcript_23072:733-1398(+)
MSAAWRSEEVKGRAPSPKSVLTAASGRLAMCTLIIKKPKLNLRNLDRACGGRMNKPRIGSSIVFHTVNVMTAAASAGKRRAEPAAAAHAAAAGACSSRIGATAHSPARAVRMHQDQPVYETAKASKLRCREPSTTTTTPHTKTAGGRRGQVGWPEVKQLGVCFDHSSKYEDSRRASSSHTENVSPPPAVGRWRGGEGERIRRAEEQAAIQDEDEDERHGRP